MKLVSVGEITIDRYLTQGRSFVGGISLNFAVNARRAGAAAVSLVSRVGEDEEGRRVLRRLAAEGVDATRVAVVPGGRTAEIAVELGPGGERRFPPGGYHPRVLAGFRLTADERAFICRHDVVATMGDTLMGGGLFGEIARDLNFAGRRVADFGDLVENPVSDERLLASFRLVDLAFCSGDRALVARLAPLAAALPGLVVVTLGAGGSAALLPGGPVFAPAVPVARPVDSTGCGDAFQAAFTVTYLETGDAPAALRQGARRAAEVLGHLGAIGGGV